ncbi:TetR/AcrR family transcriptional regulator [Terriglobus saanensis]|uniref:Regulatory protein TetR n=1 Tax=Terriglobus saanensis (strain ATCC BAA-1853 / DSM 23119 / SP1PR4) TaxID=401053 RepID=E8V1T5_TERSS|nr:TetR/AcrR family transcriptional regulator [Terriglobus saanensis]ADV83423.1 regulatory protein TetR [Terriglobus saanensis SP1PR4]
MENDTAERILDSAHALIAERGYAAFSYADIADVVKIRKASIHYHFPSKEALVTAVLKRHRAKLNAGIEMLNAQIPDPFARLAAYMNHWEGCIRAKTEPICIAALLGAELPTLPEEVKVEIQRHFQDLRDWFRETLEAGVAVRVIRLSLSAAVEAESLLALVHGAMISARAYDSTEVFALITEGALKRLSPGI